MALSIVGLAGNVRRPSRTSVLVQTLLDAVDVRVDARVELFEMVDVAPTLFRALTPEQMGADARAIIDAVEAADLIVVGTPVYRASYTGALKHLLDLVRYDALTGKAVLMAATGGTPLHGLVTEHQLRPLFGYFNTITLPTTVYATEDDFLDFRIASPAVLERIERAADEAASVLAARPALAIARSALAPRLPAAVA